jgi:hypothetical protein
MTSIVSEMSIDDSFLNQRGANIGLIEYAIISWTGREDGMTVKLALYLVIRLHEESKLRVDYDSLAPPLPALAQSSNPGHGRRESWVELKGKGRQYAAQLNIAVGRRKKEE